MAIDPGRPTTPRLKLAVLTCMDARLDVFEMLGLRPGDAHVLRNAGGRVTADVIRSLALSQALLGTEEIRVIHHTDCAMTKVREEDALAEIERLAGEAPPFSALTFRDDREALLDDVAALKASPFLKRRDRISGHLYDVAARALLRVPLGEADQGD